MKVIQLSFYLFAHFVKLLFVTTEYNDIINIADIVRRFKFIFYLQSSHLKSLYSSLYHIFLLWGRFPPIPLLQRFVGEASADAGVGRRPSVVASPGEQPALRAVGPSASNRRSSIACILPVVVAKICRCSATG